MRRRIIHKTNRGFTLIELLLVLRDSVGADRDRRAQSTLGPSAGIENHRHQGADQRAEERDRPVSSTTTAACRALRRDCSRSSPNPVTCRTGTTTWTSVPTDGWGFALHLPRAGIE